MRRECVQETEDVLAIRDEYRLQEWSQIIQAGQNSGLSKREFCRQNGISERQYYYWLKKLRETVAETASPHLVHLEAPVPQSEGILRIQIGQADLRLPVNTDAEAVAAILRALYRLCQHRDAGLCMRSSSSNSLMRFCFVDADFFSVPILFYIQQSSTSQ